KRPAAATRSPRKPERTRTMTMTDEQIASFCTGLARDFADAVAANVYRAVDHGDESAYRWLCSDEACAPPADMRKRINAGIWGRGVVSDELWSGCLAAYRDQIIGHR